MDFKGGTPNTMNFTSRMGIKVLVAVVVAFGAGGSLPSGTWRHRHRQ
jgi:hypothetical protein